MSAPGPGGEAADDDYEYRGLIAEAWDVFRANAPSWPDVAFYRNVIQASGQPVLDVGCATGRLVLAYLEEGIDADAVDVSPEMLAIVRRKAAERGVDVSGRLFQQQLETLALPGRYRTIVVSSSTFQLLTELAAATEALRRLYAHLEPGGTLVMSLMLLWKQEPPAPRFTTEWSGWREAVRASDGAIFRRRSRSTFDMVQQVESTEDEYELLRHGRVVAAEAHARSPATRWYTQAQAVALLDEVGFTEVRLTSEFTLQPGEAGRFAVLCARESSGRLSRRPSRGLSLHPDGDAGRVVCRVRVDAGKADPGRVVDQHPGRRRRDRDSDGDLTPDSQVAQVAGYRPGGRGAGAGGGHLGCGHLGVRQET